MSYEKKATRSRTIERTGGIDEVQTDRGPKWLVAAAYPRLATMRSRELIPADGFITFAIRNRSR